VPGWDDKLSSAIGDTRKLKDLELSTVGDLLRWYPRTYVAAGAVSRVADLEEGQRVNLVVTTDTATVHEFRNKRTGRLGWRVEVTTRLEDGPLGMTFFEPRSSQAEWRRRQLVRGTTLLAAGEARWNRFKSRWELVNPDVEVGETELLQGLLPIYPTKGKVSSWQVMRAVRVALDVVDPMPDLLPPDHRPEGLLPPHLALEGIHRPETEQQWWAAAHRIKLDEAFTAQVALAQRRHAAAGLRARPRPGRAGGLFDELDERLPFTLTEGQQRVEGEILADLARDHPMHRLLQGEVASGKTVVALRAMLRVVDSGGQAALLAPTEVLAQQHHRSMTKMLGDLAAGDMLGGHEHATTVALLTGSLGAAARKEAMLDAASGRAGIVVGTHALLEDKVQFADLGLVVVDEQHRFGVEQRAALTGKAADPPHVLVMTATPIPRTVAMTVFGDLETSSLRELPAGRAPIQTTVVPLADQPSWADRVWARVREEVGSGRQVYVLCPRITGDEDEPAEPLDGLDDEGAGASDEKRPLAAVEEVAQALGEGPLAGLRIDVLHGRLTPDAKDSAMSRFAAGEVDVLVCTTVVEVGVDVGNATTMVVLDADRFGISQLHQLRGRVGRGGLPGLCLLVTHAPPASSARVRLDAVASTTDGFALADLDLELRREGDVLGTSQSGTRRTLRLLSVARDGDVIAQARELATAVVDEDPTLEGWPPLAAAVAALQGSADYLEKA
jgi:ATP-dependent DNA helicase RecG